MYCLTQLYLVVEMCIELLRREQLHVSAIGNGHFQPEDGHCQVPKDVVLLFF